MNKQCDICFDTPCSAGCYEWAAYWESLTPAEKRAEEAMIERHVAEQDSA